MKKLPRPIKVIAVLGVIGWAYYHLCLLIKHFYLLFPHIDTVDWYETFIFLPITTAICVVLIGGMLVLLYALGDGIVEWLEDK